MDPSDEANQTVHGWLWFFGSDLSRSYEDANQTLYIYLTRCTSTNHLFFSFNLFHRLVSDDGLSNQALCWIAMPLLFLD